MRLPLAAGTVNRIDPFRTCPAEIPAGRAPNVTASGGLVVQVVPPAGQVRTMLLIGVVTPLSSTTLPLLTACAFRIRLVTPVGSGVFSERVIGCVVGTTPVGWHRLTRKVSVAGAMMVGPATTSS